MRHFVLNSVLRASLAVYRAITRDRRRVHPRGVVSMAVGTVTLYTLLLTDLFGLKTSISLKEFTLT